MTWPWSGEVRPGLDPGARAAGSAAPASVPEPPDGAPETAADDPAGWSSRLRAHLTRPGGTSRATWRLWLVAAIALSTVYAAHNLHKAFLTPYVVQDDARQHVFWMWRFQDPGLFPNDLIADYFQSIAPAGYSLLYRGAVAAGFDPITFDKILPVALGCVAVGYGFALARRMLDVPAAAFLAGALLAQDVWMMDDVPSGTPRAFGVPLVMAFLYYLSRRSRLTCLALLALQGFFYPQALIVSAATLALWAVRVERRRVRLTRDRADLAFGAAGLVVAGLTLLPFALRASDFGPVITVGEALRLPEFWPQGRTDFFGFSPWHFWVEGQRSGLLPKFFASSGPFLFASIPMLGGFLLPLMLRRPARYPLASAVTDVGLLGRLAVASIALFAAAQLALFKLHLPSRYSGLGVHVGLPVASGLVLALALDRALRRMGRGSEPGRARRAGAGLALGAALGAALAVSPLLRRTEGNYVIGRSPAVYAFFAQQPKDVRIASLSLEANNIPSFSQRSVLVNRETLIPYHMGYFRQVRTRTIDLLRAEYTQDPRELAAFVGRYRPDFFLVDREAFTAAWVRQAWISQFHPQSEEIARRLERGSIPALGRRLDRCAVLRERNLVVVQATCVAVGEGSQAALVGPDFGKSRGDE